jgi:hypothetical protein
MKRIMPILISSEADSEMPFIRPDFARMAGGVDGSLPNKKGGHFSPPYKSAYF